MLPSEPIWSLDRHETGDLFWRRDSSKVKFRCEVEVLEFIKDPEENNEYWARRRRRRYHQNEGAASHPIIVVITCVGAIVITVLLPWFMIGSNVVID
ncbi:CLUMA_CG001790, isoform A [Clunio marinus]|uniref:CLUMA_CG001790, isoform A n=1 Tax=Clunio marinus TaxID=568069 RepID=A0A1J1HKR4_9DIPT|nr:CLUMA_CG001790, isoform A [Clunio marinus]